MADMRVTIITFIFASSVTICQSSRGSIFANIGSFGGHFRQSLFDNDRHILSGIGNIKFDTVKPVSFEANKFSFASATGGIAYENVQGSGLSLTNKHSEFGNALTGAGRLNLLKTDDHTVSANAFITHNMANNPRVPEFQTVGGGVDYSFRDKMGASIAASRTPFLQETSYAVTGSLNLYREGKTSIDLDIGVCKTQSPFLKGSWETSASVGIETRF